jgi:L-asparaginase
MNSSILVIMQKKRILVLYTGGTFGMDETLNVPKLSAKALKARLTNQVPEMAKVADCDVEIIFNIDSCEMNSTHWFKLADRLVAAKNNYDGAVILHGTDTLAYTASALSFLLSPSPFPVVITGAQKPLATLRNDARNNLISALEVAAHAPKELQNRVLVVFHDEVFLGSRIRKKSALDFAAFESPRFPVLATVGSTIHYQDVIANLPKLKSNLISKSLLKGAPETYPHILSVEVAPGFPAKLFSDEVLLGLDGILLTLYTSGTAPTNDSEFMDFLRRAKKMNVPVFAITEREEAPAKLSTYSAGKRLQKEGVLWCGDLTPEAAYVRAGMLALLSLSENQIKSLVLHKAQFFQKMIKAWEQPLSDEATFK